MPSAMIKTALRVWAAVFSPANIRKTKAAVLSRFRIGTSECFFEGLNYGVLKVQELKNCYAFWAVKFLTSCSVNDLQAVM